MTANKLVNAIIFALMILATALSYVRLVNAQEVTIALEDVKIGDPIIDNATIKPDEPPKEMIAQEAKCLAENIYHEARNQPIRGQLAVAAVTLNRVKQYRFADSICGVVYQRSARGNCEFTWLCKGRRVSEDNPLFREKYQLAQDILDGNIQLEYLDNAVYYHEARINPWWARKKSFVDQIGAHKFYAERQ